MGIDLANDHYLPLFVGDFLASTATWTGPERGLYVQLLMLQWSAKELPSDTKRLARITGYTHEEFMSLWPAMEGKFQRDGNLIANARLEQIRDRNAEIQRARSDAGKAGADARWHGKGNALANNKGNGKIMPSDPIRSESDPEPNRTEESSLRSLSGARDLSPDFEQFLEDTYPATSHGRNTAAAFHRAQGLVGAGKATEAQLRERVAGFRAFADSGGYSDPSKVPSMQGWFEPHGEKLYWSRDWKAVPNKAQRQQDANVSSGIEWLRKQEAASATG